MKLKFDVSGIAMSLANAGKFVLYAAITIPLAKFVFTKWNVWGISDLIKAI